MAEGELDADYILAVPEENLHSDTLVSNTITLDEEDIFQCGRCRTQFSALTDFVIHKQEECGGLQGAMVSTLSAAPSCLPSPEPAGQKPVRTYCRATPTVADRPLTQVPLDDDAGTGEMSERLIMDGAAVQFSIEMADSQVQTVASMLPLRTDLPAALLGEPAEQVHVPRLLESTSSSGTVRNACDVCHKTFSKRFDLLQHRRRHTGEKPFQCPVCGRCFTQKSNLKRHIESHRVWPGGARQTLPADPALAGHHHCRHCQQTFRGYGRFKSHLRQHDQIKVYRCPQPSCGVTCAEQQRFLEHLRHHHAHLEFACHVCGQVFASLGTLSGHVAERHGSATDSDDVTAGSSFRCSDRYVCSRCQNRYCSLSALEHHLHTSSHNFTCKLCAKVFNSERFLRRHLLTHSSTARFSCNKCAKAFNTQGYLRAHMNTHNEQRQFCCDTCKKRFKRRDQLRRHQLIHSDKRLLCPFHAHSGCSRTFSRSDKLNLHVVTHAAARHKCKTCGKLYSRQDAMAKHSKRCVLPLPCATCGKEVDAADSSDHACAGTDKSPADLQPPACHAAGLDRPPDCDVIGHVTQPLECDVIITEDGDGRRPERSGCVDSPLVLYVPVLGDGARMELVSALTILGAADIGADGGHVSLEDSVMAAESVDVVISEVGDAVTTLRSVHTGH